jgi:hypothetical protein
MKTVTIKLSEKAHANFKMRALHNEVGMLEIIADVLEKNCDLNPARIQIKSTIHAKK